VNDPSVDKTISDTEGTEGQDEIDKTWKIHAETSE